MMNEDDVSRKDHMEWAKHRARQYLDRGDIAMAFTSFCSDLGKHEETEGHAVIVVGMQLLWAGHLSTVDEMRKFIEGTN